MRNNVLKRTSGLLLDALQMEKVGLKEFTAARLLIEKGILREAMDRADSSDIRALRRNVAESKALIGKRKFATDINVEFHSLLAKASKNRVYMLFERTINDMHLDLRRRRSPNFAIDQAAVQVHEEILEALIRKERDRANRLLERHLLAVSKHYGRGVINFLTRDGC